MICDQLIQFIRELYGTTETIPLHAPQFVGNEKKYLLEAIDSTYVSSVGEFVGQFEHKVEEYTGAKHAIATVNGTAALHMALKLSGVKAGSEVITQSLTFVATCNAIRYCGAIPLFIDVDKITLGLSADGLEKFLEHNAEVRDDGCCWNINTEKKISACLPMHTFGFPVSLDKIKLICDKYKIPLVEDAAESLGSFYNEKHTGTTGKLSALSFNGNKIITTGGGGMILTNDSEISRRAKHITTTSKLPHRWKYVHDEVGYNYRLPNLNAALGVAQMELLPTFIKKKRAIAHKYQQWGGDHGIEFLKEPNETRSNYWLNSLLTKDREQRDQWLSRMNEKGLMARPIWTPMHKLPVNQDCMFTDLRHTEWLFDRLINVPSSVSI